MLDPTRAGLPNPEYLEVRLGQRPAGAVCLSRARAVGAAGAVSGRGSWESSSPEPGCKQSWDRPGRCRAPGPGPEPAAPLAHRLNRLLPAGHLPCGMLHHGVSPEVGVLLAEPQGPEHETSREQPRSPRAGALPVHRASLGQSGPGSHTVGGREGGREGGRKERNRERRGKGQAGTSKDCT